MLPTSVLQAAYRLRFLLNNNASTILTSTGVAGTVTTAVLTARSTFKASEAIAKAETRTVLGEIRKITEDDEGIQAEGEFVEVPPMITIQELSTLEKVKLVWPLYIPPTITGITTIMAIIYAHKVDAKKIAALVAATSVSEKALVEFKEKVEEKLTKAQATKVHDEIVQDKVDKAVVPGNLVILDGKVLCMDIATGRYFESTREEIDRGINEINHEILNHMGASLAELHEKWGLASTPYTDLVGWNSDNLVEVAYSTATAPDGRPCLTVDFNYPPTAGYLRMHD